jgi:hypothetical protein
VINDARLFLVDAPVFGGPVTEHEQIFAYLDISVPRKQLFDEVQPAFVELLIALARVSCARWAACIPLSRCFARLRGIHRGQSKKPDNFIAGSEALNSEVLRRMAFRWKGTAEIEGVCHD